MTRRCRCCRTKVRSLYDYFRQQFAQVTNPPIDPLRETHRDVAADADRPRVQHLRAGRRSTRAQIVLASPILSQRKLRQILALEDVGVPHEFIDLQYDPSRGTRAAIVDACATQAESGGARGQARAAAVGPLSGQGQAAGARAARHRRGASAPGEDRAALQVQPPGRDRHRARCASLRLPHRLRRDRRVSVHGLPDAVRYDAQGRASSSTAPARQELGRSYRRGIRKGLFKIMSKMGISTIASYRSAQLFEIVGLADEVVQLCFSGTESRMQGADFADLEARRALPRAARLESARERRAGRALKYVHGGEYHMYNPDVIAALQAAVISGDYAHYRQFAALVNERPGRRAARPAGAQGVPRRRCRSKRSSRWRRSWRASTAPACRSGRSRPRRTRRSRSP